MAENRTSRDKSLRPGAHVSLATSVVAFALSRGIGLDRISEATGVSGQDLADPDFRPPEEVMPTIWVLIANSVPSDRPLTMEMAKATPFSFFADIAHGVQFASTLGEAIDLLVNHQRILSDQVDSSIVTSGDETAAVVSHPLDRLDGGRMSETGLALAWRLISHIAADPIRPVRVELAHAPTGAVSGYRDVFETEPVFGAPRTALVLPTSARDGPVQHASAELFVYVKQHLGQTLTRLSETGRADPLERLKTAVIEAAHRGAFTPDEVARTAGLSYRQAQRMAARHGATLRLLIEENRLTLARDLLVRTDNTVETIALLLGYADDRVFRRAFKRSFSLSPSAFRRTRSAGPAASGSRSV